jgi:predicted metal-dependent hydrolase
MPLTPQRPPEQLNLLNSSVPAVSSPDGVVVRESPRARRLILQVRPPDTVEVVVPKRTSPIEVERFITLNRAWIERAHEEIRRRYPEELRAMPTRVGFPALERIWDVHYHTRSVQRAQLRRQEGCLDIFLPDERIEGGRALLRRWLMDTARRELKPRLQMLSKETGLSYKKVQVRTQRTRWGSCSSTGTISLNAAALFLDADLMRYLMIHELCHLKHLNHSKRYWQLVEKLQPDSRRHDRRLGEAWVSVPSWAMGAA